MLFMLIFFFKLCSDIESLICLLISTPELAAVHLLPNSPVYRELNRRRRKLSAGRCKSFSVSPPLRRTVLTLLSSPTADGDEASSGISTLERSLAARRATRPKMMIPMESQPGNTRE